MSLLMVAVMGCGLGTRVEGSGNLVRMVRTEMVGAGLFAVHFRPDMESWSSRNPLRVELTVPELQWLSHRGGGTVDVSGEVVGIAGSFTLYLTGGGTAKVRGLDTRSFLLDVSGGG